jgi:hypothetical protein
MRPVKLAIRFVIVIMLVTVMGGTTLALAKYVLPALDPSFILTGSISGELTNPSGVKTTLPITVTASGLLPSGAVITSTSITTINPTYVFTPLIVGDATGAGGYFEPGYEITVVPVTWTVSAQSPASCYSVAPLSHTVYLTSDNNVVTGVNFTPLYVPAPASVTIWLTEVVGFGSQPPTSAVIAPPTVYDRINHLVDVQFKLTRSDGAQFLSPILPSNTAYTFINLLADEPPNGSCAWVYTATLASIQPYKGVVPWTIVPAQGVSIVVGPGSTSSSAHFITYHFSTFVPITADTPDQ